MVNKELLCKLISYKTVYGNDKSEFIKCFNYIENYLNDNKNLIFKKFEFNNNISMLISNTKSTNYDIVFLGHIDVVDGTINQFDAKIVKDKLYGRGSFDMKGHDSIMIDIMRRIDTSKKVALILTSDEERGGFFGIPKIMEKYPFIAKLVIVPDGGNNFNLITEEKGVLQLELIAHGKSAHASKPYAGDNAIVKLLNVYSEIIKKYPLPENENDFRTSINLGTINGGEVVNVVPNYASMMLDIRHVYSDTKVKIINDIKSIDNNIEIKIFAEGDAYKVDMQNKNVKKYIEVCEEVLNKKIDCVPCESASDARLFEKYGISAIIMNGVGNDMHGSDEYIELSSLSKLKRIYETIIERI